MHKAAGYSGSKTVAIGSAGPVLGFGAQASKSGRYRTFSTVVSANGGPYQVLVAAPMDSTEATLRRVRMLLLWAAPAVLLLASLGGFWISRRALAPVDEIRVRRGSSVSGIYRSASLCPPPATRSRGFLRPGTACWRVWKPL